MSQSSPGNFDSNPSRSLNREISSLQTHNHNNRTKQPVVHPYQVARQKALLAVVTKIRESLDLETIFTTTAQEVRQLLDVDRVGMYRFDDNSDYNWGEFVSESVVEPYPSTLAAKISDHCFGENFAKYYEKGRIWTCSDIYELNLSPCHIDILARFQVRANLVVPLLKGDRLWGLLCLHQCNAPRYWNDSEIEFVTQIATHLDVALQHAEAMTQLQQQSEHLRQAVDKAVAREKAIAAIIDKIRRSLDLNTIFNTTVQEVRQLLKADRVTIYRFNPDWSGEFVVEAVTDHWTSLLAMQQKNQELCSNISDCSLKVLEQIDPATFSEDTHLRETEGGAFTKGEIFRVVEDIYTKNFSSCYLQALESYQARSYAIIAIYENRKLWGLLAAFQNDQPRQWQTTEVNFLVQIGAQLGVAVQQAQLLEKSQRRSTELQSALTQQLQQRADELVRSAERESAIAQIIDKIRLTLDLDTIFDTTVTEVRQLLEADRVAIYRFDPQSDYIEGEFISEDVVKKYGSALQARVRDRCFGSAARSYTQNHVFIIGDLDSEDLEPCYRNILKQFNVRANLVVPLIQNERLWGLLCIHQCDRPRHWESREIEFVQKIAVHLGVALQQAQLLKQAQDRSTELRTTLADLNAIVDNLADGLLVTDVQSQITRFNPALLEMFDWENVDLKGQSLAQHFPPELVRLIEESERQETEKVTADVKLGRDRFGQALATCVIKEADGEEGEQCVGSVILIRDVTLEREVDRMKTDFLATVSHELRTPLTSVLGFASIIKEKLEEKVFPEVQSRDRLVEKAMRTIGSNIDIIIDEAERLTSLIEDVLDIAKMEAGRVDWDFEAEHPEAIIDRAIAATTSLFKDSHLTLSKEVAPDLPQIYADRDRLIQVLINLISNAVKFTQQGSVTCRAFCRNLDLYIEISDTGIGIAPEDRERVFERFQQVGDVLTDKPKGTGLGLPICKQIIEHHSGRIWVDSQLGQGSTFTFTVPGLSPITENSN
ncbi:MAG: GAF domain-containing protein [Jaaginema sp. PMC 1079.18]|nr:GAF domain-containing protein [Jaaginema sp. PMC 1080.18]MEC4852901.1 GAF domain-containing protein [Jaaginema sp. PMC 1079.18]MEC4864605.1 GAF domain-containing protein [Jaaginema sp. PMC 1078.18]